MHDWDEQPYTLTGKRPMRYNAPPGTRVQFAFPKNGFEPDQERARVLLAQDRIYTVTRTVDHGWHTSVYLYEVPGHPFNSVLFWEVPKEAPAPGIGQKRPIPPPPLMIYRKHAAQLVRAHRCLNYVDHHAGVTCLEMIAREIERMG